MKTFITLGILLFFTVTCFAQIKRDTLDIEISGRIDTTDTEVYEIYHLFKNYLESRPDSLYDNPYWNAREKRERKGANPAIFYIAFYTLDASPKIIFSKRNWKPFILTIEKKKDQKYGLRVAFIKDTISYDKILTILNLNAMKENGKWVLENTFNDVVNTWITTCYKNIRYVYPKTHIFNDTLAKKSVHFFDSVGAILDIKVVDTLSFYICDNPDEMGLLFGFAYYYLNHTTGMSYLFLNQIFSSKGNEYYPHEFVHMISKGGKGDTSNYIIQEGMACFLGEYGSEKYEWRIVKLAKDYGANKPTYTLPVLLKNEAEWNGYQTAYPTGSVLAEIVFDKKGYAGIKALAEANTNRPEQIYTAVRKITGLNKVAFEKEFRKKLAFHLKAFDFSK
ncbi:MAG: hypothetical protein H7296_01790 [Bacteroidia bacterium]|nr:hypothetical protein [Bacteroidia bacterium]